MVAKNALLFAALLASSMLFALPGDWYGQVFINGTLAADGTSVCAYVNGGATANDRTTIGEDASGYYLLHVAGSTGDNVTFNVFCDSQYPAKEGKQAWSSGDHALNLSVDHASTAGNASDIVSNGTGSLNITINGTTFNSSTYYSDVEVVNISSSNGVVLSFGYDFGNSSLNFSNINISVGNSSGASYISVSGVNATGGQSGTKTLKMYNVSGSYNAICVEDQANVTYVNISAACTGTNEIQVPCSGTASGITCTQVGTTITISGLRHSAAIQFSIPAPTPSPSPSGGSSSSGGGSVGGGAGASASSSKPSTDYLVDVGTANCTVSVKRELVSGNVSVLTTTLENKGGSECSMTDFVFADTVPDSFPAGMNEINFTPAYSSLVGWKVSFSFPSFAGGESKSITYTVGKWVPPSRVNNFTTVELSAKKKAAAPATPVQNATQPVTPAPEVKPVGSDKDSHGCIPSAGYTWCEAKQKCLRSWEEACTAPTPAAAEAKGDNLAQTALIAFAILLGIAVVAGAVFFLAKGKKHKGM